MIYQLNKEYLLLQQIIPPLQKNMQIALISIHHRNQLIYFIFGLLQN